MFQVIKPNIKTITSVIICFLSYQSIGLALSEDDVINSKDSGHHSIKHVIFPETSMPDHDWWKLLWPDPKSVILSLSINPDMISIDLCCGYGHFTSSLAQLSLRTYGVELDGDLLEKASRETDQQNIKNCFWIQGDAMNIESLVSEKVDFIFLANAFHGVPDKKALGKGIFSALKPSGKLAVVNWHKRPQEETTVQGLPTGPKSKMRMSPIEVEEILCPLGFTLQKVIDFPPYHYGSIFIR